MKPVINLEEKIGKTVGRRTVPNPFRVCPNEVEDSKAWRRTLGGVCGPKGVFKFRSHEEADAWLMKHLTHRSRS